jgi:hypothetical protein
MNRTASPRGLALGSVSGICGRPVEEEKRARRGVEGSVKCGAQERVEARGVEVKVPLRRRPLAWAEGSRWLVGIKSEVYGKTNLDDSSLACQRRHGVS